jgi:hypothetical protein
LRFWIELQRANLQYWKKHHRFASTAVLYLILLLHHALRVPAFAVRRLVGPAQPSPREAEKLSVNVRTLAWLLRPSTVKRLVSRDEPR